MKKILILAFVALTAMVSSCSKDDSNPLVGVWQLESRTEGGVVVNLTDCEKRSTATFTTTKLTSLEFEEDKTTGNCGGDTSALDYSISGSTLTVTNEEGEKTEFLFSVSGNKLTLKWGGKTIIYVKK